MKFKIKSLLNGGVLFSAETESLKAAVELAIKLKADLSGAYLYRADLSEVDLSEANLSGAYLSGANLSKAYLSGANLSKANLSRADLSGAYLYRADLSGAYLYRADLSKADLYRANLSKANLSRADLSEVDLSGANLYRANLYGADLSRTNFSRINGINKYLTTPLYLLKEQTGKIRAYKLVKENGEGPFRGGIIYKIGKTYSVKDANEDERKQCAPGINLASLDWCITKWKESYRILIAEFTAQDIVVIPIGSDGKFRVRKCKIVGEKNLKEIGIL